MPAKDRRSQRPPVATRKRVTTVNDLFTRDDINGILADLNQDKAKIGDLIVIYTDRLTGAFNWQVTDSTLESMAVWLLEKMRNDVLNGEREDY